MGERHLHRFERIGEAIAETGAPQEAEELGLREFGRAPDAAIDRIDRLQHSGAEIGKCGIARWLGGGARWCGLKLRPQRIGVLPDLVGLLRVDARHLPQDLHEGRAPEARVFGEIGATPEGLCVGGEEHGERPAALLAERMQRAHIDRVHVGALLAVHLDVDEQLVHHRSGGVVLEALMRHDVAPMAGGIADREQYGFP